MSRSQCTIGRSKRSTTFHQPPHSSPGLWGVLFFIRKMCYYTDRDNAVAVLRSGVFCFMRNIKFQNNQYYHIYNRGVDKRRIFKSDEDFKRFLKGMGEFNDVVTKTERKRLQRKEPEEGESPPGGHGGPPGGKITARGHNAEISLTVLTSTTTLVFCSGIYAFS